MPNRIAFTDDYQSIGNIGEFIMEFEARQNNFLNALVNRIGLVLITSKTWANPWAVFKKGYLEFGETVEEIYANIAKPFSYDPSKAETDLYKREIPDVRAAFHTMNFQKFYKVTISNDQLRQAFLNWSGITDLIAKIVDTLYTSMNLDEYLTMKYMLCKEMLNGGFFTVVTEPISGAGADPEDAVAKYREYTNNLTFLKSAYNRAHVRTHSPIEDQVIIVPNEAESIIGVKVLASAFHLNEVDYLGKRVAIDSFSFEAEDVERLSELFPEFQEFTQDQKAALAKVNAVKVDKNWWMVFDNFQQFTQNYNGQGLYWQYFYHVWKTFSVSPYSNAVAFTSQASAITGVTVSPSMANVTQGAGFQLAATVAGTGLFDKTVSWSIAGETKGGTSINPQSGVLHVAKDEPADTQITVTATAVDGTEGTASITVTAA